MPDYSNDIIASFLTSFCKKLLPHREFNYAGVFDSKHRVESLIEIDDKLYKGSLRIEITECYKDFNLYEYYPNLESWTTVFGYTNLKMINVYYAYEHLNNIFTPFYIDIFKD